MRGLGVHSALEADTPEHGEGDSILPPCFLWCQLHMIIDQSEREDE